MSEEIQKQIIDKDKLYEVHLCCGDCLTQLNATKPMMGEELHKKWTNLVMTSGFNAGSCPNGCRATYSDLNINTKMMIWNATDEKYLDNWEFW